MAHESEDFSPSGVGIRAASPVDNQQELGISRAQSALDFQHSEADGEQSVADRLVQGLIQATCESPEPPAESFEPRPPSGPSTGRPRPNTGRDVVSVAAETPPPPPCDGKPEPAEDEAFKEQLFGEIGVIDLENMRGQPSRFKGNASSVYESAVSEERLREITEQGERSKVDGVAPASDRGLCVSEERVRELIAEHSARIKKDAAGANASERGLSEEQVRALIAEHTERLKQEIGPAPVTESGLAEEQVRALIAEHGERMKEDVLVRATALERGLPEERVRELIMEHGERVKQEVADVPASERGLVEERVREMITEHGERVKEDVLGRIQTASTSTRPATSTSESPVTASTTLQAKAAWVTNQYASLWDVPDCDLLSHCNLEVGLVQRALNTMPKHSVDEIVIRDVVTSVVGDIVGIFEALIDRILLEKKTDTIRSMVSDLMTEDLPSTIDAGRERIRKEELNGVTDEVAKLRSEAQEASRQWEERFAEVGVLRDAQVDMESAFNQRCTDIEGRLAALEGDAVRRGEFEQQGKATAEEIRGLQAAAKEDRSRVEALGRSAAEFEAHAKAHFAPMSRVQAGETKLEQTTQEIRQQMDAGFSDIRQNYAQLARVADLEAALHERLKKLSADVLENDHKLFTLSCEVAKDRQTAQETYVTKLQHNADTEQLAAAREELGRSLRQSLDELSSRAAEKTVVAKLTEDTDQRLTETTRRLEADKVTLDEHTSSLTVLQDLCHNTLATREFATEVAVIQAKKAAAEADDTLEIAALRRDFEDERARSRNQTRQHQTMREDVNAVQELVHDAHRLATESVSHCQKIGDQVSSFAASEAEKRQKQEADVNGLRQLHTSLESRLQSLQQEHLAHVDFQRGEADKLRQHSTERYLEQIDRALGLQHAVGRLETGHKELKETFVRLPKVA